MLGLSSCLQIWLTICLWHLSLCESLWDLILKRSQGISMIFILPLQLWQHFACLVSMVQARRRTYLHCKLESDMCIWHLSCTKGLIAFGNQFEALVDASRIWFWIAVSGQHVDDESASQRTPTSSPEGKRNAFFEVSLAKWGWMLWKISAQVMWMQGTGPKGKKPYFTSLLLPPTTPHFLSEHLLATSPTKPAASLYYLCLSVDPFPCR